MATADVTGKERGAHLESKGTDVAELNGSNQQGKAERLASLLLRPGVSKLQPGAESALGVGGELGTLSASLKA